MPLWNLVLAGYPSSGKTLLAGIGARQTELLERTRARGHFGAVESWDKSWEPLASSVPTYEFRNDNLEDFSTNYYLLAELLNSGIHPFRKGFLSNIFPKILG